jgi:DNA-binding transcriptional LysR family regulator
MSRAAPPGRPAPAPVRGAAPGLESAVLRRLRLRHLELLTVLRDQPTVRGAARRLNLSQPAVSKMLREIEAVFGAPLFERSRSGVQPNALGQAAIRRATVICNEVALTEDEIGALRSGASAVLRIGTFSITSIATEAIARLRALHPGVAVRIREGAVSDLLAKLLAGELDCVFGALAPDVLGSDAISELASELIRKDRVSVVASSAHRLARARKLQWKDLQHETWVLQPLNSLVRRAFMAAYFDQGLAPPSAAVETLSPITMAALIGLDPGLLGAMRSENVPLEQSRGRLVVLPVAPVASLPPLALFSRRTRADRSPILERFLAALHWAAARRPRRPR